MFGGVWGGTSSAWVWNGRTVHIIEPPLHQLVTLVLSHTPMDLVCATVRDPWDGAWIIHGLRDRRSSMSTDALHEIADGLAELWFGCPRWTAQEIWWRAISAWPQVDGELSMRGVDVMTMPPPRATNTIRAVLAKWVSGSEEKTEQLHRELTEPPPRVAQREAVREVAAEESGHDFMAAMALASKAR